MQFDPVDDIRLAAARTLAITNAPLMVSYIFSALQTAITKAKEEEKVGLAKNLEKVLTNFSTNTSA